MAKGAYTYPPVSGGSVLSHFTEQESALLQSALFSIQSSWNWRYSNGAELTEEDTDILHALIASISGKLMTSTMIAAILPYSGHSVPDNCLVCNGSIYNRVDYPALYDALDDAYILDANSFFVPDLREKFVMGSSSTVDIGSTGGEAAHTLTVAELPAHSHTTIPHSHSEVGAVSTIINGGIEAPASAAVPFAGSTGLSDVTINETGGNAAHNNIPPYHALIYVIVAS